MFQQSAIQDHLLGKGQRLVLELSTLIYFVAKNSAIPLVQQYIFFLVEKKHNLTALKDNILNTYHLTEGSGSGGNVTASYKQKNLQELTERVNEESTLIVLLLNVAELLPSTVLVLVFGVCSDVFGRRKFLMWLPCIGNALYVLAFLLPIYICNGDIDHPATKSIFVLGALLSGLSGNIPAFFSGNASYISDTDSPKRRTLRLAVVELTVGLSFGLANFGHGFWIAATKHFEQPLWFIFCLSVVGFLVILLCLKEPHGDLLTNSTIDGQLNIIRKFKGIRHLFAIDSVPHKKLWCIVTAFMVYVFVQQVSTLYNH